MTEIKIDYEVLIIGGGPAGLSAAMTLGRIGRSVLVCDDNRPRNAPSLHINNFPSRDGIHPVLWRSETRKDLEKYKTVHFHNGEVKSVIQIDKNFEAFLSSGQSIRVKKVILAYGMIDVLPEIEGFRELWGKSVLHCAFCHGYEVRNQKLGIVSNGDMALHVSPLISGLSSDLIIITNGSAQFTEDQKKLFKKNDIKIVEGKIKSLKIVDDELREVVLENDEAIEREALFLTPHFPIQTKSSIGTSLGCEKNEMGFYKVGEHGETTVAGVYAAGDNVKLSTVLISSASGVAAGTGVVFEILNESFNSKI